MQLFFFSLEIQSQPVSHPRMKDKKHNLGGSLGQWQEAPEYKKSCKLLKNLLQTTGLKNHT